MLSISNPIKIRASVSGFYAKNGQPVKYLNYLWL